MKKFLIGLAALLVLVVAVLVAAPFFIPVDIYKEQIAERTRSATGRELQFRGDFRLSLLPRFELAAEDVVFANAPGASDPQMASLKSLLVRLQVWPLLSGALKVDSFVLVEPVIHLEVDEAGRGNWRFAEAVEAQREEPGEGLGLEQLSLGDVRLENGLVTYRDARTGRTMEASGINMTVSLPDLDSPVQMNGSLVWKGQAVELDAESGNLRGLMDGKVTALDLALSAKPIELRYSGQISRGEPGRLEGALELDVPSIRELAAWTGNPMRAPATGLGPLEAKGKLLAAGQSYRITEALIALDGMNAMGEMSADLGGARPYVEGRLEVDRIDMNAYLPPESAGAAQPTASPPAGERAAPEWSDEPMDLTGLKVADVEVDLVVGAIEVREFKLGRSVVSAALKDGRLVLELKELELYQGSGSGQLTLDSRGEVPALAKSFAIRQVRLEPLLRDAAGFDRLEGTGRFDISMTAKGRSQKQMVEALNGTGSLKFVDGAIKGLNLAAMVRNVSSAFLDAAARKAQKTDFAELSGTFQITNGILHNDDLLLLNPLLRLAGRGTVDVSRRMVDYRLEPKAVATTVGQGGTSEVAGVTVPVIIEGPWDNLAYKPDLAGMASEIAKDPSKALEGARKGMERLEQGGGLKKMLEGVTKPPAESGDGSGADPGPGGTIKKLLGN